MRFDGEIFPINPKYEHVLGYRCYPGLEALPAPPDLVAFSIGYTRLEAEIEHSALYTLADFAMNNQRLIESIDVNPLVVHEEGKGCVAVDALIIARALD